MELTAAQLRVLGCLLEKRYTTPDHYPLTTNALVAACNQKSNREPVVDYSEREVDAVMLELRQLGLARTATGGRSNKHKVVVEEVWDVDIADQALLAVLFLRGPQTLNALRTRTDRYHSFADLDDVERTLQGLAARSDPMVAQLDRQSGEREVRWTHLLADRTDPVRPPSDLGTASTWSEAPVVPAPTSSAPAPLARPIGEDQAPDGLEQRIVELERLVARLYDLLGEDPT